jgi:amino acid adenylation domain-containing protein
MQVVATLHEPLDEAPFLRGWQRAVERHPVLRSRFRWEGGAEPVQDVFDQVEIPIERLDWGTLSEAERQQQLLALLDHDRDRGINLNQAPLMRLTLCRCGKSEHRMLWTYHHAILDGRARFLVLRDVFAFYQAFLRGEDVDLPLPRPYREYIDWLRTLDHVAAQPYWQQMLAGFTAPTPLVVGRDREAATVAGTDRGSCDTRLPAALTSVLRENARVASVTLNTLVQGAWALLLHRYSGELDIVFGATRACRRSALGGADDVVGMFINTLPLRVRVDPEAELVPWLQQLRAQQVALRGYEHTPLVEVQGWSDVPPGTSLFETILVFENQTLDARARTLGGTWSNRRFLVRGQANLPLVLNAWGDDELLLQLDYSRRRFADEVVERMLGHLRVLLGAMADDPRTRLKDLPLLTEAERHQLLVDWNDTAVDYPQDRCIHQLFEAQVARTPEAVAVVFEDKELTYAELNARANQLAHHLISLGVGPEALVVICMERSLELIVGLLGILKAGGAYVPLDPAYPAARLGDILEDTQTPLLMTLAKWRDRFLPQGVRVFCLDDQTTPLSPEGDAPLAQQGTATDVAYVIYTSGSTGQPKGVAVPHRAINRLVLDTDYIRLGPGDCVAHVSNVAFDAATFEIWGALLNGARLVGLASDVVLSPEALAASLRKHRITSVFLTTALFNQVAREAPTAFATVRDLLVGGEAADPPSMRAVLKHGAPRRLLNVYGPTEVTTFATWYLVDAVADGAVTVPIGRPISNTTAFVLDAQFQPVPIGVPGELCLGGEGLAVGYLNRAELTAQRFIADPFAPESEARLYRTGDLARRLENGDIEYLGRIDHQVKIRGFRIELGEIEAVLGEHPAVRQAVVLAREDAPGDKRLVAYVVPTDAALADVESLRALLRERLPEYMRPAAYVLLERLPLTPNGKVDRKALPAPQYGRGGAGDTFVAPRNALEELIAEVWREVLKLERVGVHDNFFELGGHSLLAAQVVARLVKLLKLELPLRRFFEIATVSALAAKLQKMLDVDEVLDARSIVPVSRMGSLPLSFAQQRLWFLDCLLPDKGTYNIPTLWRLSGVLDVEALRRSIQTLVERHETLRTCFVVRGDEPVQVIGSPHSVPLPMTDLSAMTQAEREARARHIIDVEVQQPFDLGAGPLLRAQLLRLAAEEHLLLLNVHHIAADGWSMGVLWRELSAAYDAYVKGQEPELPALPIQYADYAIWQRQWLQGEVLEGQLAYWKDKLADLPTLELPADRPRPPVASHQGAHVAFDLPAPLTQALRELSRREGATLYMTLLAAFEVLLYRYSGQEDIAVGTPIAGRGRSELEGLIGFFVNTLVLRTDLSCNPAFTVLLARVRENALGAYTHQDVPFEKLVEELSPGRDMSRNPLFQVMFVLQNAPGVALALEGVEANDLPLPTHSAKFELTLAVSETAAGLHASWEYSSELFDASTVERMAGHYERLLEGIVADAEQRIGQLPLLTAAERHRLLVEWNDTAVDYPQERCIHQLFEAQVVRTPEAVAVVFEDKELTYAELNARANQLARHLVALGVGPEVLVGICMERSLELIVGLLGILKAGGTYVPLDPGYPQTRLAFMLKDTAAPVLLTQEALLAQLSHYEGRTLCLDRDWPNIATHSEANLLSATTAESLAYVIYTSGSTGRPKGTCIEHRSVVRLVRNTNYIALGPEEVFLQFAPISFDASTFELWGSLLNGAMLVVCPAGQLSLQELGREIQENGVTTLWLTAALFHHMVDTQIESLRGVRQLLAGGEALSVPHVRRMLEVIGEGRLINGYGPTENTTFTCCYVMTAGTRIEQTVPIGRPISNTRVYVLDGHMRPVPVGVYGELYIAGDGLAREYLHQPGLTAEKFVPDPFSKVSGARMYHTGDLVRYLQDGTIEFLGRIDNQVKIRGYRIELGEIEVALLQHPAVREAVIIVREDTPGDKQLVAYIVPADASFSETELLRAFLEVRLPNYMLPSAFVTLDALPLTLNGKIDRKTLPTPERPVQKSNFDAPRTESEKILAGIWAELLGLESVGMEDDFFELGGHSLLALRMLARAEQRFGIRFKIQDLVEKRTIRRIAATYADSLIASSSNGVVLLREGDLQHPLFCLPGLGGVSLQYQAVAAKMKTGRAIFAIELHELGLTDAVLESIIDTGAAIARRIREVQAHGPYSILGYSYGGNLAFEIARFLVDAGQQVELVALLDAHAPGSLRSLSGLEKIGRHLSILARSGWRKRYDYLAPRIMRRLGLKKRISEPPHPNLEFDLERRIAKSIAIGKRAFEAYTPSAFKGRISLIRATDLGDWMTYADPSGSCGWGAICTDGVDVIEIGCKHLELFTEPHLSNIAILIDELLATARSH